MNSREILLSTKLVRLLQVRLTCQCGQRGALGKGWKTVVNGDYVDMVCMKCGRSFGYVLRRDLE